MAGWKNKPGSTNTLKPTMVLPSQQMERKKKRAIMARKKR